MTLKSFWSRWTLRFLLLPLLGHPGVPCCAPGLFSVHVNSFGDIRSCSMIMIRLMMLDLKHRRHSCCDDQTADVRLFGPSSAFKPSFPRFEMALAIAGPEAIPGPVVNTGPDPSLTPLDLFDRMWWKLDDRFSVSLYI